MRKSLTFATEEDDRVCLLRDLDLFLVRGRDEGSESASLMVGTFANGNIVPPGPGLADRARRGGHAMARIPSGMENEQQICCR